MEVHLAVVRGEDVTREIALRRFPALVGRHTECSLRVSSRLVSRRHCEITLAPGGVIVRDLDSSNGTFINGARIVGTAALNPGDVLEVGPVKFQVDFQPPTHSDETYSNAVQLDEYTVSDGTRQPAKPRAKSMDDSDTAVDQRFFPPLTPQEEMAAAFFDPLDEPDNEPTKPAPPPPGAGEDSGNLRPAGGV